MARKRTLGLLAVIGPGLLVAATGVGAGDLATGAFTGNKLGVAVLWAVALGAFIKFVLNEGLARWQLATGQTVLEGALFMPLLAVVVLLLLNGRSAWVGRLHRNRLTTTLFLIAVVLFFLVCAGVVVKAKYFA